MDEALLMKPNLNSPSWSLDSAYTSITSAEFIADQKYVESQIPIIAAACSKLEALHAQGSLDPFVDLIKLCDKCDMLVRSLSGFTSALATVDTTRNDVLAMNSKIEELSSRLEQSSKPLDSFLVKVEESFLEKLLTRKELVAHAFNWKNARTQKPHLLSDNEETLLAGLEVSGHSAWETLYDNMIGAMKCEVELSGKTEVLSLSQAYAILYGTSETDRKNAWHAIQKTWRQYQVPAAAILNALAGWRIEVSQKRSKTKPMNFLTQALHDNRIEEATLTALISCCRQNLDQLRRAPRAMAKVAGKAKLDPWDLTASCPALSEGAIPTVRTYPEGLNLVTESFAATNSAMADFAKRMDQNAWVDAKALPTKSTGGYCTELAKSREPRVFMTYTGSTNDISTLAHEFGHAYHYWVMRDIELTESSYPSTLAETASVFAEQTLRDHLNENSKNHDEKMEAGWSEMESILAYLIDIPTRFNFEKNFHEKRQEQTLSAEELCTLMDETHKDWYGDTCSGFNTLFWATKMHFSLSGSGFYNFPYAFGYLFAMSLYARRKERGPSFNETYVAILRDTGRMTAEELIQKHLGEDIRKPQFWQASIDMAIQKIAAFEKLISTK
jgi:oligoendopeptidase F